MICDLLEENWPSMALVGEMLTHHLQSNHHSEMTVERFCHPMNRRFTSLKTVSGKLFNIDRLLNRFWDYPLLVRRRKTEFDLFHIVDHSYSQLAHQLPPERTVITCHDLDTFKSILEPEREPRSIFFRKMSKYILEGFTKAARVTCDSVATRDQLLAYDLVAPERTVVIHNGVHPVFSPVPDPSADSKLDHLLDSPGGGVINILHVGSTIPRKRIDVLLRVFAALRREFPQARLVRVGGPFTTGQRALLKQLDLTGSVMVLPHLERDVLASAYRRADLVLQPSESEGFGLPVIEALACGTPVVASDLAVLREVGEDAPVYCSLANISSWSESVIELLYEKQDRPHQWFERKQRGLIQAAKFSWADYARKMVDLYAELL